jgi:hypothetical protein
MGPNDIELGDEVIEVERKPRAGVVVSVRLSAEEADQLQNIAEQRQTTLSKVAREALTGYLAHGPEKAPVMGSWTGTVGVGGHFELTYAHHGSAPQTAGSVKQVTPSR